MQKLIDLDLYKDSNLINIKIPKNTLVNVLSSQKIKKAKKLKINDVLNNSWIISNIKLTKNWNKKITIQNNLAISTNTIKDFCIEMDKIFPDSAWDLKNVKAKKLCEVYNIKSIEKLFIGLKIENIFDEYYYFSGALMLQDKFTQEIKNINTSTFKQLRLL